MTFAFDEIQVTEVATGTIIRLIFKDTLKKEDYEQFVPMVEKIMAPRDKIRMLIELRDFKGWSVGAMWEDTKFGLSHFNDIDCLAIVGDKQWEKTMAAFIKPFTTATVKYFDLGELDAANVWISE